MFVAVDDKGCRISLLEAHTLSLLKAKRQTETFYCQACGGELVLKLGQRVAWHFAHKSTVNCEGEHERESIMHLLGKQQLYYWFKHHGYQVDLEYYLPSIKQRADLVVDDATSQVAIEYQCSTIMNEQLMARTQGYSALGIPVMWLLGGHRLKSLGNCTYKLSTMDFFVHRRPHQNSSEGHPMLIYYHTETDCFIVQELLFTLTSTRIIAHTKHFPRTLVTPKLLSLSSLPPFENHAWIQSWLQQKERWRTKPLIKLGRDERYLYALCMKKNLVFSCFPAFIGIPVYSSIYLATPTYIWQMWLALHFIYRQPDFIVNVSNIISAFMEMVNNERFILRPMLGNPLPIKDIVIDYLNALCQLDILVYLGKNVYRVQQTPAWEPDTLEELMNRDRLVIEALNNVKN